MFDRNIWKKNSLEFDGLKEIDLIQMFASFNYPNKQEPLVLVVYTHIFSTNKQRKNGYYN